jgi:predicted DNA-binding transcriptional regulator YafY
MMYYLYGVLTMDRERILYIFDYLSRYTDENHAVSIKDIKEHLAQVNGIKNVDDATIRRDIARLINAGNNIVKVNRDHNRAYYALIGKGFSLSEIRCLIDSVTLNTSLSPAHREKLIRKFEGMCSDEEKKQLVSRIEVAERSTVSADLLKNLDKLHSLIAEKRTIDFAYSEYDEALHHIESKDFYELLPVNISFQDKHYYLKCYRKIDDVWLVFRIDRMREIESGNVTKRRPPKTEKTFYFSADMYEPERNTIVTLKVKLSMVNDLLEKLGEYAAYSPCRDDKEYGILTVRAGINKSFYLFLLGCGSGVELVSPPEIRAEYLTEVRKMLGAYKEDL